MERGQQVKNWGIGFAIWTVFCALLGIASIAFTVWFLLQVVAYLQRH